MWQFWVDRGGTFTDIVALSPEGRYSTHKLLSENPEQYPDAAVEGIRRVLRLKQDEAIPSNAIDAVKMGTTVATNALLERKGDDTLLLITEGFADLLRIGYQNRPDLFNLHIELPDQLYKLTGEIPERVDAQGHVLSSIDTEAVRKILNNAFNAGIRSVAIAFLHAYKNPEHESIAAELAREAGFTQISTSHQVSRMIKLIGRADTTVVDAYLSPILKRYVNQVTNALDVCRPSQTSLFFMQSNGGLTDAAFFRGKDAILSGPAGGVVGMVKTAEAAGYEKLIGFDMGGTSTDVCHYDGEMERSFDTEVAGVRLRTPMMHIHTVAAGGGSILKFEDGRYKVGPESAGADPGPACYRRGGPLTVTDCNVMLGKIQPAYFPQVFGVSGDQALDAGIVAEKFTELAITIATTTGDPLLSPEEVAAGFLRIAIQNMARAIKRISVERGYDVTRYALNCFGGAGGQHAALVADALGIKTIFIHPFAGVLSAFGMGLADIRELRQQQFDLPLSNVGAARRVIDQIAKEAIDAVLQQGVSRENIALQSTAYVKYEGSHQSLPVTFDSVPSMQHTFEQAHIDRFGFSAAKKGLIIDMLSCEAIGAVSNNLPPVSPDQINGDCTHVSMYIRGGKQQVPLVARETLKRTDRIAGPAIISEQTGTVVVEPGWSASLDNQRNLILTREPHCAETESVGTRADPVMLEIFNNLFMSIAEQMGETLANTAHSVNIKERFDFSCALFDKHGNLVANAPHVPVHLGSMSESVKDIARKNTDTMKPGDSFMMNAPFNGGTHLPDITVVTPVFDETTDELIFFVGSRGHHADIGGTTPGSAPADSQHIDEEGVLIDNFRLVEHGKFREQAVRDLLTTARYPCRNIEENLSDIEAQIAANATGIREIQKMIANFSLDTVQAYMRHVQDNAEASVRAVIESLRDSSNTYRLDNGAEIHASITVNKAAGSAVIDFTGTSAQQKGNYNAPMSICHAVVLYVFRTLVGKDIPLNQGCPEAIANHSARRINVKPAVPGRSDCR